MQWSFLWQAHLWENILIDPRALALALGIQNPVSFSEIRMRMDYYDFPDLLLM